MFQTTVVFQAIYESLAKIIVLQGGTASSKTISALQENIVYACNSPGKVVTVTSESIPNLKKGAYRDTEFLYSVSPYFRQAVEFWNKSNRVIYFKNGSVILESDILLSIPVFDHALIKSSFSIFMFYDPCSISRIYNSWLYVIYITKVLISLFN